VSVAKRKLPVLDVVVAMLVVAAGVFVYWWAHRYDGRLEESKDRGAVIVDALERYRAAHGTYPDTLAELVPGYVPSIEAPTWGLGRWHYRRFTPAEKAADTGTDEVFFQLSVAANDSGFPLLFYDYVGGRWVLNN
jgi:type II secretory pathway pseudopilin PulG